MSNSQEPQANLGLATTADLLNEIQARLRVDGKLNYRPADPQDNRGTIEILEPESKT